MADLVVELPGFFRQEVKVESSIDFEHERSFTEKELKIIEESIIEQCRESILKSLNVQTVKTNQKIEINSEERVENQLPSNGKLLQVIQELQLKSMQEVPFKEVSDFVLDRILNLTESGYGFIGEVFYEDEKPYLLATSMTDISWDEASRHMTQMYKQPGFIFRNLNTLFGAALVTKQPVISNNPKTDPRSGGVPPGHPVLKAFMAIPFIYQDELIGLCGFANRPGGYTEELIEYLQPLSATVTSMIKSLRINQRKKLAEQQLVTLVDQLEQKVYQRTKELAEINKQLEKEIVEKTLIYQNLEQAKIAAEQSSEAKSQFVACITHELRTPMNSVLGMTRLLMETELTQLQQEYLSTIHESGSTLLLLINDILDFSKIESGKLAIESRTTNVSSCIEKCIENLSPKAREKSIEILYDYNIGPNESIVTDDSRLSQIFLNIIGNSMKFTNSNGYIHVSSKIEKVDEAEVILHFSVEDNGIGIKSDHKENIFKPFVQGDTSITRKYGGTGLGLAVTKKIVELLGGSIWFESELGKGATFHFTIKGKKLEAFNPPVDTLKVIEKVASMSVLIIDENQFRTTSISNCLLRPFREKRTANSIETAKAICFEHQIDVVIMSRQFSSYKNDLLKSSKNSSLKIAEILCPYEENDSRRSDIRIPLKYSESMKEIRCILGIDDYPPLKKRKIQPTFVDLYSEIPIDILVVEDNLINQKVVLQALKNFGFTPNVVSSGTEAVDICSNKQFDLILMDVQMPDIDGFQTTKLIRNMQQSNENSNKKKSVIIALTANAMSGFRETCLEAGMDDYLKKPIDFDELRITLQHWGKLISQKSSS